MLKFANKYSIEESGDSKDFIIVTYVISDDIYQRMTQTYIKECEKINDSILSSEINIISIVGELLTIDS